jgi:hypothetical protein
MIVSKTSRLASIYSKRFRKDLYKPFSNKLNDLIISIMTTARNLSHDIPLI